MKFTDILINKIRNPGCEETCFAAIEIKVDEVAAMILKSLATKEVHHFRENMWTIFLTRLWY